MFGYQWATVQINTQYLGFAARHGGDVDGMIAKSSAALDALGRLLG